MLLADKLPGESTFFLHYLCNQFVVAAVFDLLLAPALALEACQALCGRCCAAAPARWAALLQGGDQLHLFVYARAVLVATVGIIFGFVAPVTFVFALALLAGLYPVWARALREAYRPPTVDTGGEVWVQAAHSIA